MTKLTTLLCALSTTVAAWAIPEGYQWPTDMITVQPEGEVQQTYNSSQISWLLYNNQAPATINGNYGVERHIIINGNDVYIKNFLLEKETDTWIHGTVQADGDVVFTFPQKIYQDDSHSWYLATLTPVQNTTTDITLDMVPENCNMTMRWIDGVLTQVLPSTEGIENDKIARYTGMVGAINETGGFLTYGEKGLTIKPWTEKPLTAPEFTSTEVFQFNYIDRDNAERHTQTTIGFTENEVWIQGLNRWIPEAWIKGNLTADGWEFDLPQYMGNHLGFYTFAMGAEGNISDGFTEKNKVVFTRQGESLLSTDVLCVNISTEKLDPSLIFSDMEFLPMASVVQTPPEPSGFEVEWDDNDGMGVVYFLLPQTDIEGDPLDPSKLFYNVYYNGELHTFTPENDFVDEVMTDIPATYTNDVTILQAGDGGIILAILEPYATVGVRCVYRNESETTYSEIVTNTLASVDNINASSPVVNQIYYNTAGVAVDNPTAGVYILRQTRADGTVTIKKVVL